MIEYIQDSIISFFANEWILVFVLSLWFIFELITRSIKKKHKSRIFSQYAETDDKSNAEYHLDYYKKIQGIDITRVLVFTFLLIILLIWKAGLNINFFAVAAWALIIAFKDFWLSIVSFFFVVPQYKIGDTIKIDEAQGQIIYIRMFSVWILGKDTNWESTGQLYVIPNFKFLSESVRKEQLWTEEIMRDFFHIPYKKEWFDGEFDEFIWWLRAYLDTIFPIGNTRNVGNYQSYIGFRYKLDYEYRDDKCLVIILSFIGKSWKNQKNIEKIISFVESKKIRMKER
jgi:hypothetical protein